jgi:hypothetical protein
MAAAEMGKRDSENALLDSGGDPCADIAAYLFFLLVSIAEKGWSMHAPSLQFPFVFIELL